MQPEYLITVWIRIRMSIRNIFVPSGQSRFLGGQFRPRCDAPVGGIKLEKTSRGLEIWSWSFDLDSLATCTKFRLGCTLQSARSHCLLIISFVYLWRMWRGWIVTKRCEIPIETSQSGYSEAQDSKNRLYGVVSESIMTFQREWSLWEYVFQVMKF